LLQGIGRAPACPRIDRAERFREGGRVLTSYLASSVFTQRRAFALWNEGQQHHLQGELDRAIELYTRSLDIYPTAEAYTYRGWAYSAQGKIDEAIGECVKAIRSDPSLGNPYNDIGCYLITKGRLDDAKNWFNRAKKAPRYEPRHFPYMNLGRIYAAQGKLIAAIREFERALEIRPNEPQCESMLKKLRAALERQLRSIWAKKVD
jgi:tetratricopeptide (TPR) repeat protein